VEITHRQSGFFRLFPGRRRRCGSASTRELIRRPRLRCLANASTTTVFYSQVLWGFKPRWVAGFRGEWATGNTAANDANDAFRGERIRLSPVLTFYPSEFSKIRLQYNYDHGQHFGEDHSVWLQMEFLLGAHGAHKF